MEYYAVVSSTKSKMREKQPESQFVPSWAIYPKCYEDGTIDHSPDDEIHHED